MSASIEGSLGPAETLFAHGEILITNFMIATQYNFDVAAFIVRSLPASRRGSFIEIRGLSKKNRTIVNEDRFSLKSYSIHARTVKLCFSEPKISLKIQCGTLNFDGFYPSNCAAEYLDSARSIIS
ncbi:MAG: hypothetical protein A2X49_00325 [Lentisphaerae bacterium GWF2_52_8]|nr:MAG: hypothetical protein A2X49_00325 [Lentisphaerae bacterium GWF2_52_8]